MTQIIKGGNLPLSGEPMRVAVVRRSDGPGAPEVDAAALLVGADGKVRGREDLVFYNQSAHAGSGVRLTGNVRGEGGAVADWLEIDPGSVEPAVERIVVAASCDDATFGEVEDLYLRAVSAATGEQLALYAVEDATTETAILLGEFYRRAGGWKFRAVGQGYDSGLPGLAEDFGFAVPEETVEAPEEAEAEVPVQAPVPAQALVEGPAPVPAPAEAPAPVPLAVGAVGKVHGHVPLSVPSLGVPLARCNDLPAEMGPEFPAVEFSGRGKEDIDPGLTLPKGFVVVDVLRKGDGYIEVVTLTVRGRRWREVLGSGLPDLYGVGVFHHDGRSPLRLRVDAPGMAAWTIRLRPVSTLRAFDGPVEGCGPDVLAHTGDETDVRFRFKGDEDKEGYFGVHVHRRGGHAQYTYSRRDRGRGSGSIPRGPRLLVIEADGGWSVEPGASRITSFWTRRR
ncbi:TerD family protein [Streptomyces sp. WAC01280]|uniref:TerD family protein n=1 Tax=Streptomyces sp. WAC01280 TaxID=2487424 RepID=UPI000F79D2D6|nr:TerD family protein [Streptomyces sp. WAC01280]RSS51278.1 TerD family protein [Streptomyces sp. WAC01280]